MKRPAVFFDRDNLPAGEGYHRRIREEVAKTDLFIFLISPESVEESAYARTELGFARQRWPSPVRHVLPVIVAPTELGTIPPYVRSVTFVPQQGDLVAEVLARVAALEKRPNWGARAVAAGAFAALLVGGTLAYRHITPVPEECLVQAVVRARSGQLVPGAVLDVSYAGRTDSYDVGEDGSAGVDVGPLGETDEWTVELRWTFGAAAGPSRVRGCPDGKTVRVGENFEIAFARR